MSFFETSSLVENDPLLKRMEKILGDLPQENVTRQDVNTAKWSWRDLRTKRRELITVRSTLHKLRSKGYDVSDQLKLCNCNGKTTYQQMKAFMKYIKKWKKKDAKADRGEAVEKPADEAADAPAQDAAAGGCAEKDYDSDDSLYGD